MVSSTAAVDACVAADVCVVTGAGLKDMQAAEEIIAADAAHPPYQEVEGLDDSVRYLDA